MNYPINISNVILKTERIYLRPWKLSDLDDFFEYASIFGVGENAGWLPHKNKEESRYILEDFIKERKVFAIEYNNKVIGSLGIEEYNEEAIPEFKDIKAREIGFVLSKAFWGQGIMPEAVNRVCEYLFYDVGLDVIVCGYYEGNNQSKRVQEKCGFKYLKTYDRTNNFGLTRKCIVNVKEKIY